MPASMAGEEFWALVRLKMAGLQRKLDCPLMFWSYEQSGYPRSTGLIVSGGSWSGSNQITPPEWPMSITKGAYGVRQSLE